MRLAYAALLALASTAAVAQAPAGPPGSANAALVKAGTYQVDANHTQVTWEVNHMGFSMLQGQFGAASGSITVDPARPAATKVDVTFNTGDLSTTVPAFTNHLKSKDFFDAATYPTARFVSTSVSGSGSNMTLTGNLTIKDQTKPVTLRVTFVGAGNNPMNKQLNFGVRATGSINRSDFGLNMYVPMVSDKVDLTINAAFVQK